MGCGGSKEGGEREIDYQMEYIKATDLNDFFSSCEPVLETAENLRAGFQDTLETMQEISHVNFLKKTGNLADCVMVWIWTLAANNEGDISKCKPKVSLEADYVDADLGKVCPKCSNNPDWYCENCAMNQCSAFKKALQTYIKTCIEEVKKLPDTVKNLADLAQKAADLKDKAKDSLNGLSPLEKAKALGNVGKNTMKLTKGVQKLNAVAAVVTESVKDIKELVDKFPEIVKTANDYGKKAMEKKITLPADIMQHLHPSEKFTDAQIKKMKEDAEKKRKADAEAKKKKDDLIAKLKAAKEALTKK